MSSVVRRIASRALVAAGVAAIAMFAVQTCESSSAREVLIVVDPRPLGDTVHAIRVDVLARGGPRGAIERVYRPGETITPVELRIAAPGAGAELMIEVESAAGPRRVHRPLAAAPGSTVTVILGDVSR
jgi:hypothetical protein